MTRSGQYRAFPDVEPIAPKVPDRRFHQLGYQGPASGLGWFVSVSIYKCIYVVHVKHNTFIECVILV